MAAADGTTRYICIRLGNPLGIMSSDDVDVCYPHTERHGETSTSREEEEAGMHLKLNTNIQFQLIVFRPR